MANPVGEESWLAYLEETVRNASELEQRVNAVEIHKRAAAAEPGSMRIWLAYCDYFWSLWSSSQSSKAGWSDEEQAMGRELFAFGTALDLWQQGYEAVKYRLDDSHVLWDRWISVEMELLEPSKTSEGIRRITHLYTDRLLTPHLSWEETSQRFSSFLSEYSNSAWEEAMKDVTVRAKQTKRLIDARDPFELKLKQASRQEDSEVYKSIMMEYLEWEMLQSKRNNDSPEIGLDLCCGLYARALTSVFATDENVWKKYVVFLSSAQSDQPAPEKLFDILGRAVQHCPWSGGLWNRYILCAEEARLPFAEIESIKHAATSEDQLYKNGMESMIEMYVAWCGFLKRRAMDTGAPDEAVDVADVGLGAALENVEVVGQRLYGKDFQGDPKFRLERIYIQYLTEKKKSIDMARQQWEKLASVQVHADSYDFWFRYYMWEMLVFSSYSSVNRSPTPSAAGGFPVPTLATAVLYRAAVRRTVDWPERVLEVYLQHCNDYEIPLTIRRATDMVQKAERAIRTRREREEQDKAAAYAAYYGVSATNELQAGAEENAEGSKRKRSSDGAADETDNVSKRQKNNQSTEQQSETDAKRDRENNTIIVSNLPGDVTQTKLRQYFKEYGHINSVTAFVRDEGGASTTALIEFRSAEEARSALLRDQKYFGQSQISVHSGYDLTIYVANYPPTADEAYMRDLFSDCGQILSLRWPSLKVNAHRRFCYISFRDRDASAKAVAKEGTVLEDKYRLLAKYSDPARKKNREGAVAEGREVHVSNLDRIVTEPELKAVFSKYGTVKRVNLPQNMAGKNRGFAFLDFASKEEAEKAAAEMNDVKFRDQIIQVMVSKESKVKLSAKSVNAERDSASPASSSRDAEGDEGMHDSATHQEAGKGSVADISARSIALMGLPDTVNDARVRALVEDLGTVVQIVLQPSHGGAKIEFSDAATAGKASLQLNSMKYEGHTLRTGDIDELRHAKPAVRSEMAASSGSKLQKKGGPAATAKPAFMPQPTVRRPGPSGKHGPRRGLGFAKTPTASKSSEAAQQNSNMAPKSNADFKAMFLAKSDAKRSSSNAEGGDNGNAEGV